jgi:hypothetical protein
MGVSFSPGGAQWDYVGYGMFRRRLAALDGIDLDKMRGFTTEPLPHDWDDYPTALEPLLNSSDVRGFISSESCRRMLPRLSAVADQWRSELAAATEENPHEAYDQPSLESLIEGMTHCAEHGCALQYG